MPFHKLACGLLLALAAPAPAADEKNLAKPLTTADAAAGWVMLFDGESAFGWTLSEGATVENGVMKIPAGKPGKASPTAWFGGPVELRVEYRGALTVFAGTTEVTPEPSPAGRFDADLVTLSESGDGIVSVVSSRDKTVRTGVTPRPELKKTCLVIETDGKADTFLHAVRVRPLAPKAIFDGKTLAGWKAYTGDVKREKSVFAVTPAGELSLKNGPGDLQTEKTYADFVLQLDAKTLAKGLNSGVFFRGLPGQYQQGYECQIQNLFIGDDRTKPVDFGTGSIYRRVKARKVVPNDEEWFTLTLLAVGDRVHTWVNGYPTADWTDARPPADNGRNGKKLAAGVISLQGHDPTTDLLFRNIRLAEAK